MPTCSARPKCAGTNADASRATAELSGLQNIESAVEQAGIFPAIVEFEARCASSNPNRSIPRCAPPSWLGRDDGQQVQHRRKQPRFVVAGAQFDAAQRSTRPTCSPPSWRAINVRLARAGAGSSDRASLLDQRDLMLERLSGIADISTTFGHRWRRERSRRRAPPGPCW
jgi:flagellar hook-associated protein 1 FlgK